MDLLFGTAGIPLSSTGHDSISGIKRLHELGLGCMELEFVRGVKMGEVTASAVGRIAKKLDVGLSVHAPYYINLNARGETLIKSKERIMNSARIGYICGARNVIIHAGFFQEEPHETVYRKIKGELVDIIGTLRNEGVDIMLRIETMGRKSQFGSIDDVLDITEIEGVLPCIDFSHLHAISGKNNSLEEFSAIFSRVEEKLGRKGLDDMHMHVSGIEYSEKGELNHLIFAESDFKYRELSRALFDFNVGGMLICESPNLESDALLFKKEYDSLK
ncbi:MAG: TIM barrel protein [Candidatus Methanoperedens sp.]|nr:TIM barrel protein [Candidatus Methanoperedens sp.]MCE8428786.1 TIM barrel protein [Candidatus Methanoperedens sp.]